MNQMDSRTISALHEAVEAAFPSLNALYAERQVLKSRDYAALMPLLQKRLISVKWLTASLPLVGFGQLLLLGSNMVGQLIREGSGSAWSLAIYAGIVAVFAAVVVGLGVRQLIIFERARFALQLLSESDASTEVSGVDPSREQAVRV